MNQEIQKQLRRLEGRLQRAPKIKPFSSHEWAAVPATPGVYAIWRVRSRKLAYVGQTANLKKRMRDLTRCLNHTARRKLAAELGFDGTDEPTLSTAIGEGFRVSYLAIAFGRVELEEYLTFRYRGSLLNSPSPRAHDKNRFKWVGESD